MIRNYSDRDLSEDESARVAANESRVEPIVKCDNDEKIHKFLRLIIKKQIDSFIYQIHSHPLVESDFLRQIRKRTFSHWGQRVLPSPVQMIEAGFFACTVGDRVICIYCNLICQQWKSGTDDPCEVHRTLSPTCQYVLAKLMDPAASSIIIINEYFTNTGSSNSSVFRFNGIVHVRAHDSSYNQTSKRHPSFATWPVKNLPSVHDLVRAGFFYTGTGTIVTCFHCNGSLQNWGPNDDPTIEHARWFPNCAYAKQLCGDDLYRKIQELKRTQQAITGANEQKKRASTGETATTNSNANGRQLLVLDQSTLSRLVAARLDLPISQYMLNHGYRRSIVRRCWEEQLRLKQEEFRSGRDLYIACLILQRQNEHVDENMENVVIPSIKMKQIRDQNEAHLGDLTSTPASAIRSVSDATNIDMATASQSLTNESTSSQSSDSSASKPTPTAKSPSDETKADMSTPSDPSNQDQAVDSTPSNPCVICLMKEKHLACIPCGHLATCVRCSHSLRFCPICKQEVEAFVRIYLYTKE